MTEIIVASLHPQIEASTRSNIDETRHPDVDMATDSAQVKDVLSPSWQGGLQLLSRWSPALPLPSTSTLTWAREARAGGSGQLDRFLLYGRQFTFPPPGQGGKEIGL